MNATGLREPIFIVAMPKSASSFLAHAIPTGLGITSERLWRPKPGRHEAPEGASGVSAFHESVAGGAWPLFLLHQRFVQRAATDKTFALHHIPPHPINRVLLNEFYQRIVVHVRDPRQVTLSHLRNMLRHQAEGEAFLDRVLFLPDDFFERSFSEQLDHLIEHKLAEFITWTEEWISADEDSTFLPKILFTTYEDFVRDKLEFVHRILDFYGIERDRFQYDIEAEPEPGQFLYRRQEVADEWRRVFTAAQQSNAASLIPDALCERFNWTR